MKRGFLESVFILVFFFINLINLASAQPYINEVMPHSNNSWNNEWLELYNPGNETLNLSSWKISDKVSNDTFSLIIYPKDYALIVDDGNTKDNSTGCKAFNICNESCFELTSIGSGLNDDNETVFLYNSTLLADTFSWNESIKSIGKSWSLNLSDWMKCFSSPGFANNCTIYQNNESKNDSDEQNNSDDENSEDDSNEQDSTIKISDSPNNAQFGKDIEIDLDIYKGSTNKYALYIYVENSDKKKVSEKQTLHLRTKYKEYEEQVSLQLDCLEESGTYKIVAEGLDEKDTETIHLKSCHETADESPSTTPLNSKPFTEDSQTLASKTSISPLISNPITGSIIQESSNQNSSSIVLIGILCFITLTLVISAIMKKILS